MWKLVKEKSSIDWLTQWCALIETNNVSSTERTSQSVCALDWSCPRLADIGNGAISSSVVSYNTQVRFSCSNGYTRQGASTSTCGPMGVWSVDITTVSCTSKLSHSQRVLNSVQGTGQKHKGRSFGDHRWNKSRLMRVLCFLFQVNQCEAVRLSASPIALFRQGMPWSIE